MKLPTLSTVLVMLRANPVLELKSVLKMIPILSPLDTMQTDCKSTSVHIVMIVRRTRRNVRVLRATIKNMGTVLGRPTAKVARAENRREDTTSKGNCMVI